MNLLRIGLLAVALGTSGQSIADVTELNKSTLSAAQEKGVTIIDVRRPDEWARTGIIEGSHGITFFDKAGRYDVNEWLAQLSEHIEPGDDFILICAHGVRSSKIAQLLDKRLGYTGVHNVTRGIADWIKKGGAVEKWTPEEG